MVPKKHRCILYTDSGFLFSRESWALIQRTTLITSGVLLVFSKTCPELLHPKRSNLSKDDISPNQVTINDAAIDEFRKLVHGCYRKEIKHFDMEL